MSYRELSQNRNRSLNRLSRLGVFGLLALTCWAGTASQALANESLSSAPEKVVQVRGNDSIVQSLNMGPMSTELWRTLQLIISNQQWMEDPQKIMSLLKATITRSTSDPSRDATNIDAEDRYFFKMRSISYASAKSQIESQTKTTALHLIFNSDNICISNLEVERVYGPGSIGIPSHGNVSVEFQESPVEVGFSEAYGKHGESPTSWPLVFSYNPSGCLHSMRISNITRQ